jgi:hypothetical protein
MQKRPLFNASGYMVAAVVIIANAAAIAADAVDLEIESNGAVGVALLSAGALAAIYVLAAVVHAPLAATWRSVRRPRGSLPQIVPGWLIAVGAVVFVTAAVGANVFKNNASGVEDALNAVSFFTFVSIALGTAVLTVATAFVWATLESPRLLEVEAREQHE